MSKVTRRGFVRNAAAVTAASVVMPHFNIGRAGAAANSKVNIALIGAGGRGGNNLEGCQKENIVALCDVSEESAAKAFGEYPKAKRFKDFRVMLDTMGDEIDAVIVSTPDHTHFVAAMDAIQRGKHVYVEKPLAHNVWQVRTLRKAAHRYKIISQMGNQGHATEGIRNIREWTEAGALGNVTSVDAWNGGPNFDSRWFSKPDSFPPKKEAVPEGLDWDLWLGPARERPYNHCYVPHTWRTWSDFGSYALGDWACHTLDAPFWALQLGMPTVIEAEERVDSPEGFAPQGSIIRYEFPARGDMPAVVLRWYDGGLKPEVRPEWGIEGDMDRSGMIMTGDKTSLMTGGRPDSPKLLVSDDEWLEFRKNLPAEKFKRLKGGPWAEWLSAIKGDGPKPGSNFNYASNLTEMVLLGVLAQKVNKRIEWDAKKMKITNHPDLNAYIKEPVRKGWEIGDDLWKS